MKLDPAVHRLSKNNGAFQPTDFKVDLGPSIHRFSIYGTVQQPPPPPWWSWSGGSCVWRGCPTGICYPRPPPVGVGGGCGGSMFVFYVQPSRGGDGLEDDVHAGAGPQKKVTPAGGGLQSYCVSLCICMNLHVCVYVCVCVYVSMYVNVYVCICIYICMYMYEYACMCICICMHVCKYVCQCICMCLHVFACICMNTHVYVCVYIYMCV